MGRVPNYFGIRANPTWCKVKQKVSEVLPQIELFALTPSGRSLDSESNFGTRQITAFPVKPGNTEFGL